MEIQIVIANFFYATFGALVTIGIMLLGYKLLDWITPFDTSKELAEGNSAVGTVVGCMFISLGVSVGLVMGLGLN